MRALAGCVAAALALAACRSEVGSGVASGGASASSTAIARPPDRRSADAPELALVAPLAPGARLVDYEVVRIEGALRGAMRVVCAKGRGVVRLDLAIVAEEGPAPAATAGRYAIFWGAHNAPLDEADALAKALAEVVKNNGSAPVPAGLAPFVPRPPPSAL